MNEVQNIMQEVPASERIVLQIGEKTFHTTKATISKSRFLSKLFSLRCPSEDPYFLDADPLLFEHILRYLRTRIFPLLYDQNTGQHDEPLYFSLLHQAKFYQIDRLESWIANKTYLRAVRRLTRAGTVTMSGDRPLQQQIDHMTRSHSEALTILKVESNVQKAHRCPNGNWQHDNNRDGCIQDSCLSGLINAAGHQVQMRILKVDYVATSVAVDQTLAMADGADSTSVPPPPYIK